MRRYRQAPRLPARNVQGVMAVITPGSSEIHRLNDVAAEIWAACAAQGATVDELVTALSERYDAPTDVLRHDVEAFLESAVHKGLLLARDEP